MTSSTGDAGDEWRSQGGNGADVIYGGDGNDYLENVGIKDGQPDKFYCGKGKDVYSAEKNDYVSSSCEKKITIGNRSSRTSVNSPLPRPGGPTLGGAIIRAGIIRVLCMQARTLRFST